MYFEKISGSSILLPRLFIILLFSSPLIDEDEITASFRRFGPLVVDWPHKAESKSYFPPKGYAFLLFQVKNKVFFGKISAIISIFVA